MSGKTATSVLCNHMVRFLSSLNSTKTHIKQVNSLFSHFSIRRHCLGTTSFTDPLLSSSSSSAHQPNRTHIDLSTVTCTDIAQSIISKCPFFFDEFGREREILAKDTSIKELLLDMSDIIPDVTRRLRRILRFKPEDMLEILLGFQFECERVSIEGKKVESLWGIFKWASEQDKGFKHLPKSCEVMASLLIQYGMLRVVQLLLLAMDRQGISLDNNEIYSNLIEGYLGASDLERAVLVYDRIREQGFVPSASCYNALLDLLVSMRTTQFAIRVCFDMVEIGNSLSDREMARIEKVVRLLCCEGMVQEARNLMKKVTALGFELSSSVINEIASGYCEKKDYDDLLNLFIEKNCCPNALVGNKIIYSLCSDFGAERANCFRLELEGVGFRPDEITFAILIGWCCTGGNLRSAFNYLAEMLSRGLKPVVWSYNALISALFCEGMSKHAGDVLDEMVDKGMTLTLSTFRTLLAGYCKARQFDDVKRMVHEMVTCGLLDSSSLENPLTKAFIFLCINPLSVRLKRDNDVRFSSTEFFDSLGNGLYLDGDVDEYESRLSDILKNSMIPDFNLLISKETDKGNFRGALMLIDEIGQWGQELSLSVFSELVKRFCASRSHVRLCNHLIQKMPKLACQLDNEVLNLLARAYCKNGLTFRGRIIFNQMVMRDIKVENETYTALILGLCKRGIWPDFYNCWDMATKNKWLPRLEDYRSLIECLCHHRMLKEASELFESMLVFHPQSRSEIFHMFLEKLCVTGHASTGHKLADELPQQGCVLDNIAYNHLVSGLCKEKKYTEAFRVLDTMLVKNVVPCSDISVILIPQLCRAGKLDKAVALREIGLRENSVDLSSVNCALIRGFCMTGRVGEAACVMQDMLLKGLIPDAEMYNMLFQGYCQAKNLRKLKELLGELIRKFLGPEISSYRMFLRLLCMQGSFTFALKLKELMLGDGRYDSLVIYNILFFNIISVRNSQGLLVDELLIELQEKGLILDEASYNFLVYGFSKCKNASRCLHYLSTMISKGFKPSYRSLQAAVTCLCDLGELSEALKLSQEMEKRGWLHGSVVQNAIVEGLLSRDKIREAECFLDRMADKGLIPDTINYDYLIKQFCVCGKLSKAVDLLNIMMKKRNLPNSASYDSVIQGLCITNRVNQAIDFHLEMLDRDLKPSMKTCDALVHKLCEVGRTAEAESLLISVVQSGETPNRLMYRCVIDRYRLENNPRKASELMQKMQRSGYEPDFDTHWSLISNLHNSKDKDNEKSSQGFLSRLLSGSGFPYKRDSKVKVS